MNTAVDEAGKQKGTICAPIKSILIGLGIVLLVTPSFASAYAMTTFKKTAPQIAITTQEKYGDMISIASLLHDYDEKLILSVIVVESEGKKAAVSNRGAQGLMQLMPGTAKAMGANDPHEPFQNILAGTRYLKELERDYGFNHKEALVAYNMGPTRAKRWLSQYSPDESLYVQKVMHVYSVLDSADSQQIASTNGEPEIRATGMLTKPKTLSMNDVPDNLGNNRKVELAKK